MLLVVVIVWLCQKSIFRPGLVDFKIFDWLGKNDWIMNQMNTFFMVLKLDGGSTGLKKWNQLKSPGWDSAGDFNVKLFLWLQCDVTLTAVMQTSQWYITEDLNRKLSLTPPTVCWWRWSAPLPSL